MQKKENIFVIKFLILSPEQCRKNKINKKLGWQSVTKRQDQIELKLIVVKNENGNWE